MKSDVINVVFTLPEGEKLKGNKALEGWLVATIASCFHQGIGCVISVNGQPYMVDQERVDSIRQALKEMEN